MELDDRRVACSALPMAAAPASATSLKRTLSTCSDVFTCNAAAKPMAP